MTEELHIASLVVHSTPSRAPLVSRSLAAMPDARVHATAPNGKLVVTLQAQRDGAGQVQTLIGQVASLEQQLTAATAERAKEKAVAFIAGALKAGKPIVALQERLTAMHVADPSGTEALVNGMPNINAGFVPPGHDPKGGGGEFSLTATDHQVIAAMGLDPKKYAAERDRLAEQRAVARGEGSGV